MQWARRQKGFTIVELLIVVVVIAILAAITIVAYNGITQKANDSAAKNSIAQAQKSYKLGTFKMAKAFRPKPTFQAWAFEIAKR